MPFFLLQHCLYLSFFIQPDVFGRFISGFGIASGLVIGFTMINDVYGLKRARKVTITGFVIATSIGALYATITLLSFVAVNMLQMSIFSFGISSHTDKASASSVITFIFMIITFAAVNYIGLIKINISYLIPITVISLSAIGLVLQRIIANNKSMSMD
ncbi:MAG TPA: hypothetical protein DD381_10985 [Lentisphaeria bacterium]|nr:MAG: hypothetical protein A2X47_00615 [Lentisphaerae bacterium GWF2_38_69]HBM16852.1 hypothetical protein [Lentisphaeria bacterium]